MSGTAAGRGSVVLESPSAGSSEYEEKGPRGGGSGSASQNGASASATASSEGKRSSGSRERARSMAEATGAGTSGATWESGVKGWRSICATITPVDSPLHGRRPASISYVVTAHAN